MSIFNQKVPVISPAKNKFDLSHERKQSGMWGRLDPILNMEIVPGDEIKMGTEIFGRFAPMLAPIMARADVYVHHFFVPYRLVWDRWNDFITQSKDNGNPPVKIPQIIHNAGATSSDQFFLPGSLADRMGCQTGGLSSPVLEQWKCSQLPFRCFQEIYNEWYRDQTIIPKIAYSKGSSDLVMGNAPDFEGLKALLDDRIRAWQKDQFTTALPSPQYGNIGAAVPIISKTVNTVDGSMPTGGNLVNPAQYDAPLKGGLSGTENLQLEGEMLINELRKANALQLFLEKLARSGQRIAEFTLQMFGVRISDLRAMRPEYLGGGRQHMKISEVLSTFDNSAGDFPQGTFTGNGVTSGSHFGFHRKFEEYGQLISIMSILPKPGYQNGMPRQFSREGVYDFYFPDFAHLGEQEVKNKEVAFIRDNPASNEQTFGYQSRYNEYKYISNTSHGDFKTNLQYWHLDKIYDVEPGATPPALNKEFIECEPGDDLNRIFAVTDKWTDKMWFQIYHNISALRPMPVHSVPRL